MQNPIQYVLIGHYENDRQFSMERFDNLIHEGLKQRGCMVRVWKPSRVFGFFIRSPIGIGKWLGYLDKYLLFPMQIRFRLRRIRKQRIFVIIPDHSHGMYVPLFRRFPHAIHVHDLIAMRTALGDLPGRRTGWFGRIYQSRILKGLRQGSCFISISEATHRDLVKCLGPSESSPYFRVIPNELNHPFTKSPMSAVDRTREQFNIRSPYFLHVGNSLWYKNRQGVLHLFSAYAEAHPDSEIHLVLIGEPLGEDDQKVIGDSSKLAKVHCIQGISVHDLQHFYSGACGLLFPSHLEGFGWPIIEAFACGCPVLTTRRPPMSEIAGRWAFYLSDSHTATKETWLREGIEAMREMAGRTGNDPRLQARNLQDHAKRFAPGTAVEEYRETYEEIMERVSVSEK